ncbi:MAG: NADPH-dependent FMN reductase [Cardiobacteriaceae bacterium]|nr:NADPH-dependent FMN reductase [Cardiobacteriaceae bacterium]
MSNILLFCASNSQTSINLNLLRATGDLINGEHKTYSSMIDFDLPIYSQDIENEEGYPEEAQAFFELIEAHNGVILSCPEHNGAMPPAFKNLIDWGSRYANTQKHKLFADKPVLLLSTSPGPKGGASNLALLETLLPWQGAQITGRYSVGSYNEHFHDGKADTTTQDALKPLLQDFLAKL